MSTTTATASPSSRVFQYVIVALIVVAAVVGGWYLSRGKTATAAGTHEASKPAEIIADVVHPEAGGLKREVLQPGTVEPFEAADLYSKVSGYLKEQSVERDNGKKEVVDIGTPVKAGDILARIYVPEYEKAVQRDEAQLAAAEAKVKQMEAHVVVAQAESRAAEASIKLANVMVRAKTAFRQYRDKQLARVTALVQKEAVDEKLKDEQEDYRLSAVEAENAAMENVNTAKEKAAAASARIKQAEADLNEATAQVAVARANLEESKVKLTYTTIRSPYTGVVTKRNFHPGENGQLGDFIKAADQGGVVPLLAVERTDVMRVVVQVPDRDVPYVSTKAVVDLEIDALPGIRFDKNGIVRDPHKKITEPLTVTRWAKAEDPVTRTMRTEIDVKNASGELEHGMYGHVRLTLTSGAPGAVRIPSVALVSADNGKAKVRVVRDGKVHTVSVQYATDNGREVEVVSGLAATDAVVVRTSVPVEDGASVVTKMEANKSGSH